MDRNDLAVLLAENLSEEASPQASILVPSSFWRPVGVDAAEAVQSAVEED